jgi:hypothetical protein
MGRRRRFRGVNLVVRKAAGLLLAAAGVGLIVETLPTYLLLLVLGILFVSGGWMLFGVDRRRWI